MRFHPCTGRQSRIVLSPLPRLFFINRIHTKGILFEYMGFTTKRHRTKTPSCCFVASRLCHQSTVRHICYYRGVMPDHHHHQLRSALRQFRALACCSTLPPEVLRGMARVLCAALPVWPDPKEREELERLLTLNLSEDGPDTSAVDQSEAAQWEACIAMLQRCAQLGALSPMQPAAIIALRVAALTTASDEDDRADDDVWSLLSECDLDAGSQAGAGDAASEVVPTATAATGLGGVLLSSGIPEYVAMSLAESLPLIAQRFGRLTTLKNAESDGPITLWVPGQSSLSAGVEEDVVRCALKLKPTWGDGVVHLHAVGTPQGGVTRADELVLSEVARCICEAMEAEAALEAVGGLMALHCEASNSSRWGFPACHCDSQSHPHPLDHVVHGDH